MRYVREVSDVREVTAASEVREARGVRKVRGVREVRQVKHVGDVTQVREASFPRKDQTSTSKKWCTEIVPKNRGVLVPRMVNFYLEPRNAKNS